MKKFLWFSLLYLSFFQFSYGQKPNIIVILTDDMGVGDLACYGGKVLPTPHLDHLARNSIQFTNYYSASPICSPSRTGILTGSHPAKWKITSFLQTKKGNAECQQADFLTLEAPSIAQVLQKSGYKTGHFGKWHMGGGRDVKNAPAIAQYGFDEWSSTWESPNPDPIITSTNWIWADSDSVKRWNRTAYFIDKTLAFLQKHKGQPCFINLWPDDVHTPWVPFKDDVTKHSDGPEAKSSFKAVMEVYDREIGRLMDGLKKLGMDQNTLVIFTSDNGALPTFNGARSVNFRGSKLSLYEGGIRMPFLVHYPAKIKRGKIDSVSVLHANDLFPSLCALAGAKTEAKVDGKDKLKTLLGQPSKETRTLFWEYGRNETSFRYPQGKDRSPQLAVREGDWKLLMNANGTDVQLYNLKTDSAEQQNLAMENQSVVDPLKNKLLKWWESLPH